MNTTNTGGADADREMHDIAKEEHAECTAALEQLKLDLTSLLLPRYKQSTRCWYRYLLFLAAVSCRLETCAVRFRAQAISTG